MKKIIALLGVVRAFVAALTIAAVAAAMCAAEFGWVPTVAVMAVIAVVVWKAPFGAKYRRHY